MGLRFTHGGGSFPWGLSSRAAGGGEGGVLHLPWACCVCGPGSHHHVPLTGSRRGRWKRHSKDGGGVGVGLSCLSSHSTR